MRRAVRYGVVALAVAISAVVAVVIAPAGVKLQAALIAVCLVLWLSEIVPPFAPTLLLLGVAPMVLGELGPMKATKTVLTWAADPVLALFFGGLAAGVAARKHGIDAHIARILVRRSRGSPRGLVALLMLGTAGLSMWMSNVAAAAMMIGAARPALGQLGDDGRKAGLVGIAMAANVAGLATPVGSGPNGIAIAAVADTTPISFVSWMLFGVPLTCGLLVVVYLIVRPRIPSSGRSPLAEAPSMPPLALAGKVTLALVACAVLFWLLEPWLGVPAAVVSLGLAAALFMLGPLGRDDLAAIDWSTLLLIAGGVLLGKLTEATGLLEQATSAIHSAALSPLAVRLILCSTAAALSALMSNTAAAALLIPIALRLDPSPAGAVLVAVATSLGVPFIVSTPPNAMVVGEGVPGRDLLRVGLVVMLGGVVLVATTGPHVLRLFLSR